jgi:hypothetical protein
MKVIARNNGPYHEKWVNGNMIKKRHGLKKGKIYDVIERTYQDESGIWIVKKNEFLNPSQPKFYIRVIDEYKRQGTYWNDYFLSSDEVRQYKLNEIGI